MDIVEELIEDFIQIQQENLYVVASARETGEVPLSHREYVDFLQQALSTLALNTRVEGV